MKKLIVITLTLLPTFLFAKVADKIEVIDPYVRMVPPNAQATGAFMTLLNHDTQDHAIVKAKAHDVCQITQLHTHIHDGGVMRMRQVAKITIPAEGKQFLQPGGYHIMLIKLNSPIHKDQKIQIDLTFEDGSQKTITAMGRPIAKPMKMMKMH